MLEIKVIASGSSGNCTLIQSSAGENILLDAGIPYAKIAEAAGFKPIDYTFVTHEHGDHANKATIKTLLERGTEVYMRNATRQALKFEQRHNLHALKNRLRKASKVGSFKFKTLDVEHDAADPVAFQLEDVDDCILYATDTKYLPYSDCMTFTKMIVEANFSEEVLRNSRADDYQKQRIWENHTSIERVFEYFDLLKSCGETEKLKEVHLAHISDRHGNGAEFAKVLKGVLGEIPIYTH